MVVFYNMFDISIGVLICLFGAYICVVTCIVQVNVLLLCFALGKREICMKSLFVQIYVEIFSNERVVQNLTHCECGILHAEQNLGHPLILIFVHSSCWRLLVVQN